MESEKIEALVYVDRAGLLRCQPQSQWGEYGRHLFGQSALVARRLVEAGARFVTVHYDACDGYGWDSHVDSDAVKDRLLPTFDQALSALLVDLEERGLLNRTMIVLASEFSRDMLIEGKPDKKVKDQVTVPDEITELKHYGMHRHFTDAGSVLMFGGGLKRGHLHGVTADERPCKTLEKRVVIEDLHATIYHALGISPRLSYEIEKRPFYVTRDGVGRPIMELFA